MPPPPKGLQATAPGDAATAAHHVFKKVADVDVAKVDGGAAGGLGGVAKATGPATSMGGGGGGIGGGGAVDAGMAELIECLTLLGVAEQVVGFLDLFEFVGGLGVVLVHIGMKLARQFAIGLFDLFGRGTFGDAQHFVIIAFFIRHRFFRR